LSKEKTESKNLIKKILLPTDGSDHSLKAAKYCVELAKNQDRKVAILHIFQTKIPIVPVQPVVGVESLIVFESEEETKARGEEAIEKTKVIFDEASIPVETLYFHGHPVQVIVETAEKMDFDLIVLGSRGLGRLNRLLLGSVADGVLHNAHCPVLIVR
jgi:nucleotide-binding universal stress UspA family protein